MRLLNRLPLLNEIAYHKGPIEQLTSRQRDILQFIAEGRNTKQIAEILKISPKTVEYHRMKLMDRLKMHDVAGLVRFAMRVGLIPEEGLTRPPGPAPVTIHSTTIHGRAS